MSKKAKTNDPLATRRLGNQPKPSAVRTLSLKHNDDVRQAAVDRQNISDQKKDKKWRAQVPAGREYPTTTSSGN